MPAHEAKIYQPTDDDLEHTQIATHLPPPPDATAQQTVPIIALPLSPAKHRLRRTTRRHNWLYILIAVASLSFVFASILSTAWLHQTLAAQSESTATASATLPLLGAITATPLATTALTPSPAPTDSLAIQPWDGRQRLTILLMGIDKRPGESGTAFRTDTLMIVSIDPATHSVGMLSVPRDLFVTMPPNTVVGNGYGLQRINSAYTIGELAHPGSGPELAVQTVQYNIGIRINNYVVVDFSAVMAAVDVVGGVDINVPSPIYDPEYPSMNYGYDPLRIPAGEIHMNGALALKFARSRHQSSDLDRAKRQQQVLTAIRDKVLNLNMIPNLIVQAPVLWSQLSSDIHTDLTLDQLMRLGLYAKDIPKENIHQGVIDYHYVTPQVFQGMDILVPNRVTIGPLMVKVFGADYNG